MPDPDLPTDAEIRALADFSQDGPRETLVAALILKLLRRVNYLERLAMPESRPR